MAADRSRVVRAGPAIHARLARRRHEVLHGDTVVEANARGVHVRLQPMLLLFLLLLLQRVVIPLIWLLMTVSNCFAVAHLLMVAFQTVRTLMTQRLIV